MDIKIEHCNSIDDAAIQLEKGRLNIKYGPNGTGKSTIAKAIELGIKGENDLRSLMPFKYRGGDPVKIPTPNIKGVEELKSVVVYNEEYVNQFVFMQDEVVKNSFDIFVRNSDYKEKMAEIEGLVINIQETFNKNENIGQIVKDLTDLSDSFGKSQSGYSKAGRIGKGIGAGNKLEHIPVGLTPYQSFIKSENNVQWIKWQIEGNAFLNISTDCPYCTSPTDAKQETILAVAKEYDAKSIEHLNALQGIIARLGKYFSEDVVDNIQTIVKNKDGLKKEEIGYLTGLKGQVDTLKEKLNDIKSLSFFSLREVEKVQQKISNLKIDLNLLPNLDSAETKSIVGELNDALELILTKAAKLQGEINKQKKTIETAINKYKSEINTFLRYAGYKYTVDIQLDGASYKMKLRHFDFGENIANGALHLSYGERNAFSIVLFMYECLTKQPDLIILDDPISSFDKNKKYAILEMLFRGKQCLRDKTVLMLTHDIEPIIDMVKNLAHTFRPSPVASFLSSKSGVVTEQLISKADISTFAQICVENIKDLQDDIIKIIYLRRHYELIDDKGVAYELLSNLLHARQSPLIVNPDTEGKIEMTVEQIADATQAIQSMLPTFEYDICLTKILDENALAAAYKLAGNGYEKLQLFRIINKENHENDVVKKYINESFHIENEYIMQINPHKYDLIPEHIIAECDRAMQIQQF